MRGKTALVLNGHDGVGALIVQALAGGGVIVTAQVPMQPPPQPVTAISTTVGVGRQSSSDTEGSEDEATPTLNSIRSSNKVALLGERARLFGAQGVIVGEPLVVIAEVGQGAFDFVFDTVGGRSVWEASKWIMKNSGQVRF
jgi:hypothetical protein